MVKSQTMTRFYLTYVCLLPHLVGKKPNIIFCIFYQTAEQLDFFLYWKILEMLGFSQKVKFCSNVQNSAKSFKVCINCLLFTPLDYKLQQNLLPVHYSLPLLLCTIYFLSSFISLLSLIFFLFSFTSLPLQKKLQG